MMQNSENMRLGIRSILAHKLRSALTTLGIIFGVAGLVSMMSIAEGARREAMDQIRLLGTNNIRVNHRELTGDLKEEANLKGSDGLTYHDGEYLLQSLPNLTGVAPLRFVDEPVLAKNREATGRVVATTADYSSVTDFHAERGRFLSPLDVSDSKRVAVIGATAKQELFGYRNAIGQRIKIGGSWFTVIGLMEPKAIRSGGRSSVIQLRDLNKDIYVPITAASARFPSSNRAGGIQELALQVADEQEVVPTSRIVRRILERNHRGVQDFEIVIPSELLAQAQRTQRVFNVVMGSIAAISLLVGGIGIMNIMLTTVTERTKEIGVRRALGATQGTILRQFLVETVLMSVAGGVVGILVGAIMAQAINVFAGWETVISLDSALVAFGVSGVVGVAFGLYPARRAAQMDPIAALRFE
jgi:putative ABC transport system permease protein